jgi:hypothetical protein
LFHRVLAAHLPSFALIALILFALLLSAASAPRSAEAATAATASVTPNFQNPGDSTLFNFTINNTGTTTIYGVYQLLSWQAEHM